MIEQIHVRDSDIIEPVDREKRLGAALDRIQQVGLQRQRMVVVIDGFAKRAELQMHVPHVVPGVHHVALVGERFGELIERAVVSVV